MLLILFLNTINLFYLIYKCIKNTFHLKGEILLTYCYKHFRNSFISNLSLLIKDKYGITSRGKQHIGKFYDEYEEKYNYDIRSAMKNWSRKKNPAQPSLEALMSICNFFDCDMDFLLGKQKEKKKEYKTLSEFTRLSEKTCESIFNLPDGQLMILNAMFNERYGMKYVLQCMDEVALFLNHNGTIQLELIDDGSMDTTLRKSLKQDMQHHNTKEMLRYRLTRNIQQVLDDVLNDNDIREKARQEFFTKIEEENKIISREELGIPVPKERPKLPGE